MVETIAQSNDMVKEIISDNCSVYRITEIPGDGKSTVYKLFPGVYLIYNDYHTKEGLSNLQYTKKMISIDHCAEGRIEWEHTDGSFCYLGEQDVQISAKTDHVNRYGFPINHYHGITINFFIEETEKSLKECFPTIDINLEMIWLKYQTKKDFFVMRSEEKIQSIFSDLYKNRNNIQINYLRIKFMELVIILSEMKAVETTIEKPYFKRSQVEQVRAVKDYLCKHTDKKNNVTGVGNKI